MFFLVCLCLGVVANASARGVGSWRRRPYARLKPRPIADAAEGLFAAEGRVRPIPSADVTSPLSGRQAVGYSVRVKATCLEDRRITWDRHVQQVGDFLLQDDAGGQILVCGADARLQLSGASAPETTEDLTGCAPDPLHVAFREQHGSDELLDRTLAMGGEHLLRQGDRVRVCGEVRWRADAGMPTQGFRHAPGTLCLGAPLHDLDLPLLIVPQR